MRVRPLLAAVLVVLPLLGACGGQDEVTMPPLTPEPGDSQFADTTTTAAAAASAKETLPARMALYKYLRGIAVGNAKACAYLTAAYQQQVFGGPASCRTGFAQARAKLRPQDLAALRGVTVPVCQAGPGDGIYTVRFADLAWKGAPARPGGLLAASFTLRRTGAYWQITTAAAD
ncbi:hypothetical protein [Actinomadura bangladeshensis]|uniref:Nuclear transport factor 2 family protein n=1 Tax=Actinomadura bangladeshensis TaxID=453573 RepID=A0A6L9QJQ3_9ACTN|nr:hypothetical protein [Actinomadura bangladeshensis]NEA24314.1 hypothetical protein [Actinomadura bangladeshensis]